MHQVARDEAGKGRTELRPKNMPFSEQGWGKCLFPCWLLHPQYKPGQGPEPIHIWVENKQQLHVHCPMGPTAGHRPQGKCLILLECALGPGVTSLLFSCTTELASPIAPLLHCVSLLVT